MLSRKQVEPADILSSAKTIPANDVYICNWYQEKWIRPEVYLEWAQKGLSEGKDDYSLSNAICYAKRTACRIIDELILSNHLCLFIGKNYPAKIDALSKIGISIVAIVHELIIDPRNQLEHEYERPEQKKAEYAVQIAKLFLDASQIELKRKSIVALAWNVLTAHLMHWQEDKVQESVNFHGFSENPMLFIDVFEERAKIKIVHPKEEEVCFALLETFTEDQSIELAKKLREHYTQDFKSTGGTETSAFFYREVKRQAGI